MSPNEFAQFRYVPIEWEAFEQIRIRLKRRFNKIDPNSAHRFATIDWLIDQHKQILPHADRSCCAQIRANGFYSISKLNFRLLEQIEKELDQDDDPVRLNKILKKVNILSTTIVRFVEIVKNLIADTSLDNEEKQKELDLQLKQYPVSHRKLKIYQQITLTKQMPNDIMINNNSVICDDLLNDSRSNAYLNVNLKDESDNNCFSRTANGSQFNSLPLFTPNLTTIVDSVYEGIYQPATQGREIVFRDYPMCWIDKKSIDFFKIYSFALPFVRGSFLQYPRLLFDKTYRTKFYNRISRLPTLNFPFIFWDLSECWFVITLIKFITRHLQVESNEIHTPSQTSIIINQSSVDRLTINNNSRILFNREDTIRCKLITSNNVDLQKTDRIIMYLHGGGFLAQSTDSGEIILKRWVEKLKIPILTVAYRIKTPFPAGHQDAFDAYVWLRKGPDHEIKSILGFIPKKVVVVGESAGGNIGFAIPLILNDLRCHYIMKFQIPMCDAMMCVYTPFVISTVVCPSRALSVFDAVVTLGVQLVILHSISGYIPELRPNTILEQLKLLLFPTLDTNSWLICDKEKFNAQTELLAKHEVSPYLTALYYDKYEQLTDLKLHLISAEFCTFLDESITLAKLFKGNLKVDVIPDQTHGFLFTALATQNLSNYISQKILSLFDWNASQ